MGPFLCHTHTPSISRSCPRLSPTVPPPRPSHDQLRAPAMKPCDPGCAHRQSRPRASRGGKAEAPMGPLPSGLENPKGPPKRFRPKDACTPPPSRLSRPLLCAPLTLLQLHSQSSHCVVDTSCSSERNRTVRATQRLRTEASERGSCSALTSSWMALPQDRAQPRAQASAGHRPKATLSVRPSPPLTQQWRPLPAFSPQFPSLSHTTCILFISFAAFLPHWGI